MTLLEKIDWYYRNYGAVALIERAFKKMLGMPGPSTAASSPTVEELLAPSGGAPVDAASLIRANFPAIEPFPVYASPGRGERINLVTDNIGAGSLFGGVGTAIVLSTLLAKRNRARLRIVTRLQEANLPAVAQVLRCNGIELDSNIESACIAPDDRSAQLDIGPGDRFITTSWWSTRSVLGSVPAGRVEYLLQEDERMFYPHGDEWLRCAELLARRDIRCIVNTNLLREHLIESGLDHLNETSVAFEPAFPESMFRRVDKPAGGKKILFFYARPGNHRNLFFRGLEALDKAVVEGVFHPDEWDIVFAGSDVAPIRLGGLIEPRMLGIMDWRGYGEFIRSVDLGFCLMATPHPSYPPLDLAASGAVVLTNRFGLKTDLSMYSANLYCADLDTASLVAGLRDASIKAADDDGRLANYRAHAIERSWERSLGGVLDLIGAPA